MTYNEAKQIINDNEKVLSIYTTHDNPPHRILGCFVSPIERSFKREEYIFNECITNKKDNAEVLLNLNIYSADLMPFVAMLIWGNNILIPLESYVNWPAVVDEQGKEV